jgi:hypothetical protein
VKVVDCDGREGSKLNCAPSIGGRRGMWLVVCADSLMEDGGLMAGSGALVFDTSLKKALSLGKLTIFQPIFTTICTGNN